MQFPTGTNGQSIFMDIADTSGAPLTGLTWDSAGLQVNYIVPNLPPVNIPLVSVASNLDPWAAGGFVEVDATAAPGIYRFDLPDEIFTTAFGTITVVFTGAATMQTKTELIVLLPIGIANALATFTIDGTWALPDYLLIIGAAVAGKLSGAEGTSVTIRGITDEYDVIQATVDANGNRTDVQIVF